jgi:hypothetical protein
MCLGIYKCFFRFVPLLDNVFVFLFWKSILCVSELYRGSWKDFAVDILLKFDIFQNRDTILGNLGLKGYASCKHASSIY